MSILGSILDNAKAVFERDDPAATLSVALKAAPRNPAMGAGAYPGTPWTGSGGSAFGALLKETRKTIDTSTIDATLSSAFQACLNSYTGAWPNATLEVQERDAKGTWKAVSHPLTDLFHQPTNLEDASTPDTTATELWQADLTDFWACGNALMLVERAGRGNPVGLRFLPAWATRPRWAADGSEWISGWEYWIDHQPYMLDRRDVLHFKYGQPDWNWYSLGRLGRSPVRSVLLELFTDDEAAAFLATLLSNMAYPGFMLSPDTDAPVSPQQREGMLAEFRKLTSGANRGGSVMFGGKMKAEKLGWSPKDLEFGTTQLHIESRVAAVMNVPAPVAGLRVGLESGSQRANFQESQRQFYENGLIPLQRAFAEKLTAFLLPQFGKTRASLRVWFNTDQVAALQEDESAKRERDRADFTSGGLSFYQYIERIGDAKPEPGAPNFYVLPSSVVAREVAETPVAAPEPDPAPMPGGEPMPGEPMSEEPMPGAKAFPTPEQMASAVVVATTGEKAGDPVVDEPAYAPDPSADEWPEVRERLGELGVEGLADLLDPKGDR